MTEKPTSTQNEKAMQEQVYDLYDEYCHGRFDRREFLRRATSVATVGGLGLAFAQSLLPRYAQARTISFTDERIKARYVTYASPGGTTEKIRGYLVQPSGEGPFPTLLVVHENRGLNPYIEDVARRAAVAGFLALAPDGLTAAGGYPGNDDDGRTAQASLDRNQLKQDMLNGAQFLKGHALSSGKLGATGFCWGGGITYYLASVMGPDLSAGVPYYGGPVAPEDVPAISAPLLIQSAEHDPRINALWPDFKAAMDDAGKTYTRHLYPETRHGFHNNSTPRYNADAAKLSWERTISFLKLHLS